VATVYNGIRLPDFTFAEPGGTRWSSGDPSDKGVHLAIDAAPPPACPDDRGFRYGYSASR
jgi:hypothetical protein